MKPLKPLGLEPHEVKDIAYRDPKQRRADRIEADRVASIAYFGGDWDWEQPHPCFASTGTEGRCEGCGCHYTAYVHTQW